MSELEQLRFPIGHYEPQGTVTTEQRKQWIDDIGGLPGELAAAVEGLNDEQLDTPYRDGGWTLRQVVHHIADSHMNAYTRFKLAVTEDTPTIKPYYEDRWAELADSEHAPIGLSLQLIEALHARWTYFLGSVSPEQFDRDFVHPEHGRSMRLNYTLGMYSWHGKHHVAHITGLRNRKGW